MDTGYTTVIINCNKMAVTTRKLTYYVCYDRIIFIDASIHLDTGDPTSLPRGF